MRTLVANVAVLSDLFPPRNKFRVSGQNKSEQLRWSASGRKLRKGRLISLINLCKIVLTLNYEI